MSEKLFIAYLIGKLESMVDRANSDRVGGSHNVEKILNAVLSGLLELKLRAEQEIGFEPKLEDDDND